MESGEELSVFDGLFERIGSIATRPSGEAMHEDDPCAPHEGTRLTPERMVGEKAVKFMIFSSSTRSLETGKLLYGPAITVFRGDQQHADNFKRSELENRPNSQGAVERYEMLLGKLEAARELFDKYEQSASS